MNANLDKEQIEYIQSIVGDRKSWDRPEKHESFWRDIIIKEGEFVVTKSEDHRSDYVSIRKAVF
jgi:hypothetical protein